jgi:hypothetical protein
MKNTIKILMLLLMCSFTFVACEDDGKESFQSIIGKNNQAPYVKVIVSQTIVDITKVAETTIDFDFDTTGTEVSSYSVEVSLNGGDSFTAASLTSFPTTVSLSISELASLVGLTLGDIEAGDLFEFSGRSTGSDGTVVTADNLGGDLVGTPEQSNAYAFSVQIFCSPVSIPTAGDWTLDMIDTWGDGWDGAFVTAFIDGNGTDYTVGESEATHVVSVPEGSSLVWTYTFGSYECEHIFTMTGPDGTVYGPYDGCDTIPFCFFPF